MPMCGVPHHAARGYLAKLTELGHKVAICEQMEDPKLAKGLVKREVVRVVTPGIVLDDEVLDPKLPRYLAALVPAGARTRGEAAAAVGLAYLDVTTGELAATELAASARARRAGARRAARGARRAELLGAAAQAQRSRRARALSSVAVERRRRCPTTASARGASSARRVGREPARAATRGGDGGRARGRARAAAAVLAYARATQPTGALPVTRLVGSTSRATASCSTRPRSRTSS